MALRGDAADTSTRQRDEFCASNFGGVLERGGLVFRAFGLSVGRNPN